MILPVLENSCRHNGTSFSEQKLSIAINPADDEHVRFYSTDCDVCRVALGLSHCRSCDVTIYYRLDRNPAVFVLAELKSSDLGRAITQINSTYDAIRRQPPIAECDPSHSSFRGVIVLAAGSPADFAKHLKRARVPTRIKSGRRHKTVDVREIL